MCRAITCKRCGSPSWAGCGAHVDQVLGHVPESERCQCHATPAPSGAGERRAGLLGRLRAR